MPNPVQTTIYGATEPLPLFTTREMPNATVRAHANAAWRLFAAEQTMRGQLALTQTQEPNHADH